MDGYFKYWGKAKSDDESGLAFHLLPYHCLDVAAVGQLLLKPEKVLCQRFSNKVYEAGYPAFSGCGSAGGRRFRHSH